MDLLPMLLAEEATAALELGWGSIIGIIATGLFGSGGVLRGIWAYWTRREEDKREAWKAVVDAKDELIADKDEELIKLRDAKDERITELSKDLSKKSDQHAAKIEELMTLVVTKVEAWSGKLETVLDRSLSVQAAFTAEVREFTEALREYRTGGGT